MAKPKRIVLIRHANSASNADRNVHAHTPDHRIPLTELGHEQAKAAGHALLQLFADEALQVYLSPYLRTRETFEGIKLGAERRLNIFREYEDPRLREQDFGHLRSQEAHVLIDAERASYGTFYYRVPDGESGADVYDRLTTFLDTMYRDFEKPQFPENALIISHGMTIRILLMRWLHWPIEKFEKLKNPHNAERFIMTLGEDGKYHLDTPLREYTDEETERYKATGGRKPS